MTTSLTFFSALRVTLVGPAANVTPAAQLWGSFLDRAAPGHHGNSHGNVTIDVTDLAEACAEINRSAVAACPYPAAHAAVVAVSGGAIGIPAASGVGKSTLAAALCRSGAQYLSDEALVLDDRGAAVPYPKPLALSRWSLDAVGIDDAASAGEHGPQGGREFLVAPGEVGEVATEAVPLRHLVMPARRPDAAAELTELSRREGLAALLEMSFNHYRDPRRYLRAAASAVEGAQVWRLHYGDPMAAAELVMERLR